MMLKTQMSPEDVELIEPMSRQNIQKRMMTALPDGYDAYQLKAEYPTEIQPQPLLPSIK